jgi:hypothetical protein
MRVYDLCACTRANIKISLNGRTLPLRSLDHYASLFWGPPDVGGGDAGGGVGGGRARASLTLSDPSCPARLEAVFSVSKSASFEARVCVISLSLKHTLCLCLFICLWKPCFACLGVAFEARVCLISLSHTHTLCLCLSICLWKPCFPCVGVRRLRQGYV